MSHRYDDSDSEGEDFNPAPEVDAASEDGRRRNYNDPDSPVESRSTNHRRSSVSRDDEDGDADANGGAAQSRHTRDDDAEDDEEQDDPPRRRRDDDDEDDEEDDEDEDEDDEDDMPVRLTATLPATPSANQSYVEYAFDD